MLADYQAPKPEPRLTDRGCPLSAVPLWKDNEEAIPKMGVIPTFAEAQRRGWCGLVHLDLASVLRTDPPKRRTAAVSDDPGIDRPKIHAWRASADEQEQADRTNGQTPHVQMLSPAATTLPSPQAALQFRKKCKQLLGRGVMDGYAASSPDSCRSCSVLTRRRIRLRWGRFGESRTGERMSAHR